MPLLKLPLTAVLMLVFSLALRAISPVTQAQSVWASQTAASDNARRSVAYGNGLFVAVAGSGSGNRVMTSLDGIGNRVMTSADGVTWTNRTSAADHQWRSVTYANGVLLQLPTAELETV